MKVLAIRGATTVQKNDKEEILKETATLINEIIHDNDLFIDDIISIMFTMTNDLDKVYPSIAVRKILGYTDVPMLNFEEKYIENSMRKCIRVLMHINTNKCKDDIKHIYLNEAKNLRKDIRREK